MRVLFLKKSLLKKSSACMPATNTPVTTPTTSPLHVLFFPKISRPFNFFPESMGTASLARGFFNTFGKGSRLPQEALWLPRAAGNKDQKQANINLIMIYSVFYKPNFAFGIQALCLGSRIANGQKSHYCDHNCYNVIRFAKF